MFEFIFSQPRVMLGAFIGVSIGFLIAYVMHSYFPSLTAVVGSSIVAISLALGVVFGAAWEANRS